MSDINMPRKRNNEDDEPELITFKEAKDRILSDIKKNEMTQGLNLNDDMFNRDKFNLKVSEKSGDMEHSISLDIENKQGFEHDHFRAHFKKRSIEEYHGNQEIVSESIDCDNDDIPQGGDFNESKFCKVKERRIEPEYEKD